MSAYSMSPMPRRVLALIGAFVMASGRAAPLHAQSVPTDVAAMVRVKSVVLPSAALVGAALDSSLVSAERTKWALGNVGRFADAQPYFADAFLNIGLEPTGVRRLSKAESFALLQSLKVPPMPIEMGDWTVVHIGRDGRLVSYALRAMGTRMWVTSLWERKASAWATVFYQITPDVPMPALSSAAKPQQR